MRKPLVTFGILALTLESTSCVFKQRPQARVFAAPPARPRVAIPEVKFSLPDAPEVAVDEAATLPPQLPAITPETLDIPDAPSRRVTRQRVTPVIPPKNPTGPGITIPESPAPRLAQMFSPEEKRENNRVLDESLGSVNRILAILEGKNLTAEQKDTAERIRTYRKQAEQAREENLLTAVSLARRADLLAKDLLEHLP